MQKINPWNCLHLLSIFGSLFYWVFFTFIVSFIPNTVNIVPILQTRPRVKELHSFIQYIFMKFLLGTGTILRELGFVFDKISKHLNPSVCCGLRCTQQTIYYVTTNKLIEVWSKIISPGERGKDKTGKARLKVLGAGSKRRGFRVAQDSSSH